MIFLDTGCGWLQLIADLPKSGAREQDQKWSCLGRFRWRTQLEQNLPNVALHFCLRQLEKINDAGDVQIRMASGRRVAFNIREHPHLDHGYAVTSHSSQGQTSERVLIHVDTDKSELLINNRFANVSVSRGQYDAQIYTNDKSALGRDLSREVTQRTAIPSQEQEPAPLKMEPETEQKTAQEIAM